MDDDLIIEAEEEESGDDAAWMATYGDMMTLLLCFFVLLLSFATMDVNRFRLALGSVKDALGVRYEHPGTVEATATSVTELSETESSDRIQVLDDELMRRVREVLRSKGMEEILEVEADARGVIVRIRGHVLFDTGSNELLPGATEPLDAVAAVGEMIALPISVEGHTDDRPIHTPRFPSNWELSTARATAAMRYLVTNGELDEARMGIAGYADMRPLVPNATEEARSRNRRVEFVFIRQSGAQAMDVPTKPDDAAKAENHDDGDPTHAVLEAAGPGKAR